jgi:hypothetical protein
MDQTLPEYILPIQSAKTLLPELAVPYLLSWDDFSVFAF